MKRFISPVPLEKHLKMMLDQIETQTWTVQDLFDALKGKGYPLMIILLSLPFCQPLQIPGLSTPFGVALIFIGLRMAFGRRVWWPQWILKQKISTSVLKLVIQKSLKFFQILRPLLHSRWSWLCHDPKIYFMHGILVSLMGLYLGLPLPIPLSNFLAAWSLFLLALGIAEEDGLFVCLGYLMSFIAIGTLLFLALWLHSWIFS